MLRGAAALEEHLQAIDETLYSAYCQVVEHAEQALPQTKQTFPNYTDHDYPHARAVVRIASALTPPEVLANLTPAETFVVLAGAVLHDIGMLPSRHGPPESVDAVRAAHHLVGADRVLHDGEAWGVPIAYRTVVATVIEHHRATDITQVSDAAAGVGGPALRMQLLCALVRAADELHITEDRAPKLLMEMLGLPQESVQHFVNCQAVRGVAVSRTNPEEVLCDVLLADEETEAQVAHVLAKVNSELSALHGIFRANGLPPYRAVAQSDRSRIVQRKALLALADGVVSVADIAASTGERPQDLERALTMGWGDGLVRTGEGDGTYALPSEPGVFGHLAQEFLCRPQHRLRFLRSPYAQEYIRGPFFNALLLAFCAGYEPSEADLRRQVLCNSPTAVKLALLALGDPAGPPQLCRAALLDQTLLLGVTIDVCSDPAVVSGYADASKAMRHLARRGGRRAADLARVIARALTYKDVSIQEMSDRLYSLLGGGVPDELAGMMSHKINAQFQFPQEPAYLSLPHQMVSAAEEQAPLEIAAPTLTSLTHQEGDRAPEELSGTPGSFMCIGPPRTRPALPPPILAARCERRDDGSIDVFLDLAQTFGPEYPLRLLIQLKDIGVRRMNVTMVPHAQPLRPREARSVAQLMTALRCPVPPALRFFDALSGVPLTEPTSDAPDEAPPPDPAWAEYLAACDAMAEWERRLDRPLYLPLAATTAQADGLRQLVWTHASLSNDQLDAELQSITMRDRARLTLVQFTVVDDQGRRIQHATPHVLPVLPSLEMVVSDPEQQPEVDSKIASRRHPVVWHYYCSEPPLEVLGAFAAAMEEGKLDPPCFVETPESPVLSEVTAELLPLELLMWEDVQRLVLTVKAQPPHRRDFETAMRMAENGDLETAREILTEVVATEPTFGLGHLNLGIIVFDMGDYPRAVVSFRNAVACGNTSADQIDFARVRIAIAELSQGGFWFAIAEMSATTSNEARKEAVQLADTLLIKRGVHQELANRFIEWLDPAGPPASSAPPE